MNALRRLLTVSAMLATSTFALAQSPTFDAAELQSLLDKTAEHRVLLVGEMHGTTEVPALVGELAGGLANTDRSLILGLEIPRSEQARIDTFLRTAGSERDRLTLLEGDFWQREYQDGRSSFAMLELIERARQLALKSKVRVLAFDIVPDPEARGAARDAAMAKAIEDALNQDADAKAVILAGNFHTRVQEGAPWDEKHRFMGHYLLDQSVYAIEVMGVRGSMWICTDPDAASCKSRDIPPNKLEAGLVLEDAIGERGHHAHWWLGETTASLPAKGL